MTPRPRPLPHLGLGLQALAACAEDAELIATDLIEALRSVGISNEDALIGHLRHARRSARAVTSIVEAAQHETSNGSDA